VSLIITGNPGVGKHTIAKNLAKILDYEIFDINKIALKSKLYEKTNETNDVDIIKLKKILKKKISKKSIIVGHLAPYAPTKSIFWMRPMNYTAGQPVPLHKDGVFIKGWAEDAV